MDTNQFNGSFWLSMAGLAIGFLSLGIRYCLKSKCRRCSLCCGLFTIERDIPAELEEEKMELENGMNPYVTSSTKSLHV